MTKPVVNLFEAERIKIGPRDSKNFGAEMSRFGPQLGLGEMGCSYYSVSPGKRAFPFHNHLGCDEAFVILDGEGVYRFGDEEFAVKKGDICGAPRGGPDHAHQLINTGASDLKYLAFSTKSDPEIVEYPDSGKFAAIAIKPGEGFMKAHMRFVGRRESGVDYYDGEKV